jgi:hypothetical protein
VELGDQWYVFRVAQHDMSIVGLPSRAGILDNQSAREGEEGLLLAKVASKGGDVDTILVVETTIFLTDGDVLGTGLVQELGLVRTDVTKALYHDALALEARGEAERVHVLLAVDGLPDGEEHTETGGLGPASDTTMQHTWRTRRGRDFIPRSGREEGD